MTNIKCSVCNKTVITLGMGSTVASGITVKCKTCNEVDKAIIESKKSEKKDK